MPINLRISALVPMGLIVESVTQLDDALLVTARARMPERTASSRDTPVLLQ